MSYLATVACECSQACPHPGGWLAELDISNAEMRAVRETCDELSLERLLTELPEWNGCSTSATEAAALLPEIEVLATAPGVAQTLRDGDGRVVYSASGVDVWLWAASGRSGWLSHGRYEIRQGTREVLVAVRRFRYAAARAEGDGAGHAAYTPLDPPGDVVETVAINGVPLSPHAVDLTVSSERRPVHAETAAALRRLCEAALATGHPIFWG